MLSSNAILQKRYRIVRELGHGGMGTVYEAIDERVNCVVAVKETVLGQRGAAREAFQREAALLANLRHPALPKVTDYFSENDCDFLVMEFIPGYDLAELLDLRGSPFPQSQVLRWAYELLNVLEYLHGQEPPILHRDIKPSNLKLTKTGEIFLLDFGLAKGSFGQMPTLVTSESVRGYTPVYAPLEQILSSGTDVRSDIYSVGATLYHILSGVAPIDAPRRFQQMEEGKPDPLRPIQEFNPQAAPNITAVIHQAMAMSQKQRHLSALAMRKALRDAVEEDERNSAEEEYKRADEKRRREITLPDVLPARRTSDSRSLSTRSRTLNLPALITAAAVLVISGVVVVWMLTRNDRIPTHGPGDPTGQQPVLKSSARGGGEITNSVSPAIGTVVRNQIGMELVWIPAGSFMMGSANGDADEKPVHQVNIERPFYIGKFEVTQTQWQAVMGDNPSNFKECGGNCPVENVSWDDAKEFIRRLNERNDGFIYRLPTEAEWEYASRAGTTADFAGDLKEVAWFSENSGNKTHAVGQKQANTWGLADMHGNVWEWCEDWYHESYYDAPADGSAWLIGGEQKLRVMRGGSWVSDATKSRSMNRNYQNPVMRTFYFGLRVVAVR